MYWERRVAIRVVKFARFVLAHGIRAHVACAVLLWGIGAYAYAEDMRSVVVAGASVNNGKVVIDGVVVNPDVERYKSPATGEEYLISRRGGSVTVTSVQKAASAGKNNGLKIEARAANGRTVNAGRVVIVVDN
jgi:hypothetical protein